GARARAAALMLNSLMNCRRSITRDTLLLLLLAIKKGCAPYRLCYGSCRLNSRAAVDDPPSCTHFTTSFCGTVCAHSTCKIQEHYKGEKVRLGKEDGYDTDCHKAEHRRCAIGIRSLTVSGR